MVDLRGLKTCIFGIQKSGKTFWAKNMYRQFKSPLVFVVNKDDGWLELPNIHVWYAETRLGVVEEFKKFIKKAHKWAEQGKIDAIIIDEADMFFRSNYDIDPYLHDLVLNHRHFSKVHKKGVALWFMTRRPQDIPTKIVESSTYLIIFKLEGYNAIQRFKDINPQIPDLIDKLDYMKHNFVFKELGKDPILHKPIVALPKKKPKDKQKD